jgi:hypothetical protein
LGHKDETVSVLFAEAFCKKFKRLTAVSAGVHIEKARPGDIEMIVSTARALLEKSLARWEKTQNL